MYKKRSLKDFFGVTLRGMAMGAADVVPGVSGGTIAFITGIYEELIFSISQINFQALKKLKNEGWSAFWTHINGNFFVALVAGIAISILSLARIMTYLLETHPVTLWAFFFGLIVASVLIIGKTIQKWDTLAIIGIAMGTAIAAYVSLLHTTAHGDQLWYIFLSGSIAICAMILPGISGAFILVLLGSYHVVLGGLKSLDFTLITVFCFGCLVGILAFSHLLNYLYNHHKNMVLSILTGFMIGSLLKIWPWKNSIGDAPVVIHSDGREEWIQANVLPANFHGDPQILTVIALAVIGFALVFVIDLIGRRMQKK